MKKYDVVIIGAGIAGSALARELARNDVGVLLVEKSASPGKNTACGGLFDKRYFDKYVQDPSLMERRITRNIFSLPWGTVHFDCDQVTVKRRRFDRHLAELARQSGATLLTSVVAESYMVRNTGRVEISLSYLKQGRHETVSARLIALADGPKSLAKSNKRLYSGKNKKYWAYAYAYEIDRLPQEPNTMTVYLNPMLFPWGYGWVFPNRNESNIGVGTILPRLKKNGALKKNLLFFINEYGPTKSLLKDGKIIDKKGGFIPMWLNKHLSDTSQVALGDAAGMVSPLFGAGIDYAFDAAEACAPVILEALKENDFSRSRLQKYDRAVQEGFGRDLKKQMLLARIIIVSLKFGRSWPIKILSVIAFGVRYTRWNKVRILLYPLLGKPAVNENSGQKINHN